MRVLRWIGVAAILVTVCGPAFAQSSDDSRIQRLEETVRTLERRVAAVEAQLSEPSAPVSVVPDKVNWRKLKSGMTEGQVEQLLGSPWKVDENKVYVTWGYDEHSLAYVRFDARSRKVIGWREP